jgi:hypothetical protein
MAESVDTSVPDNMLSQEEASFLKTLYEKAWSSDWKLEELIVEALPTMNPNLIMKLRLDGSKSSNVEVREISQTLGQILDSRLSSARDVLAEFLEAGEIRKLDSLIGKAGREGKLDVAFFQVLNMNMQAVAASPSTDGEKDEPAASQYQVLQHIYTRCQEEVEKTIPPGAALLNKLLRTEMASIRSNQLNHYLCPTSNVIKTPDGKELELQGEGTLLVPHDQFIEAIGNAVKQIRTVERAGGVNQEAAASMVESCRQVAREARIVIGEYYGRDSEELKKFEENLQPVFRPSSSKSPYIQGVEN